MRFLLSFLLFGSWCIGHAQLYTLKDPAKDSLGIQLLYDYLPLMCDSFYLTFSREKSADLKKFVPDVKYLKATFDTLAIVYREEQVVYRQQVLLRQLQKDYKCILKLAKSEKIKLDKLQKGLTKYNYGEDAKGNEYSYITVTCTHRKKVFELKYLAIMLNGKWFVGDELLLERIE